MKYSIMLHFIRVFTFCKIIRLWFPEYKGLKINYTQQKKKRTTTIFPLRSPFNNKNVNCNEIFISDQILLKLECGIAEYLFFPCVDTKHIKANGKRVLD